MAALWALLSSWEPVCAGDGDDAEISSCERDAPALTVSGIEMIFSRHHDVDFGLTCCLFPSTRGR
jgi:hypothetical protein